MVDWMIQVLRVLEKRHTKTHILATLIMDKYFKIKMEQGIKLSKGDLHIVGLVSIFLSSKYEDVIPLTMNQILNDAAH